MGTSDNTIFEAAGLSLRLPKRIEPVLQEQLARAKAIVKSYGPEWKVSGLN